MTRPNTVEGGALCLAKMQIISSSSLSSLRVEEEAQFNISVVLLRRGDEPAVNHPPPDRTLPIGDTKAVLGGVGDIIVLAQKNNSIG